jgi:hypothetical protein
MEEHAMPLIRNGHAASTSWAFLLVLFSAVLGLALFDPNMGSAQEVKQIKLTEKHIQNFMTISENMAKLSDGANQDKLDAELEAQAEALVKEKWLCESSRVRRGIDEYFDDHVRHRPAD